MAEDESPMSIGIVLASREDLAALRPAVDLLARLGCEYEVFTASVWAAPERLLAWAERAELQGMKVILAAAGAEPHLPGFVAAASHLPVLAIPLAAPSVPAPAPVLPSPSSAAAPVAWVALGGAEQAALLAIRILAAADPALNATLDRFRHELVERIEATQQAIEDQLPGVTPAPTPSTTKPRPAATRPTAPPAAPPRPKREPEIDIEPPDDEPESELGIEYAESDEGPIAIRPVSFDRPLFGEPLRGARPGEPVKPRPASRRLGRMRVDTDAPQFDIIEDAVDCLLEGGVIAFPTETVYGLAADATNPAAVERLYDLKGRARGKAITLMVDSPKLLSGIACNLTVETRRLMEAFWPGPLTVVFQKRPGNFTHVSATDTIGVRLPDHSIPLAIMQTMARPLACTSANPAGQPDAMSADDVERAFGDRVNLILDGGRLPDNIPSTVIDVTREPFRILRLGAVSHAQLAAIVGEKLEPEA